MFTENKSKIFGILSLVIVFSLMISAVSAQDWSSGDAGFSDFDSGDSGFSDFDPGASGFDDFDQGSAGFDDFDPGSAGFDDFDPGAAGFDDSEGDEGFDDQPNDSPDDGDSDFDPSVDPDEPDTTPPFDTPEDDIPEDDDEDNGFDPEVGPIIELSVVDFPDPVKAGDEVTYTITITNIGDTAARDVDLALLSTSQWLVGAYNVHLFDIDAGATSHRVITMDVDNDAPDGAALVVVVRVDYRNPLTGQIDTVQRPISTIVDNSQEPVNQPAKWYPLENQQIAQGSPYNTIVYPSLATRCYDPDDSFVITILSKFVDFNLAFSGLDLVIRDLNPSYTGTSKVELSCNDVGAYFYLTVASKYDDDDDKEEEGPKYGIHISSIRINSDNLNVQPGEEIGIITKISNNGNKKLKDVKLTAVIQELGVKRSEGPFDLRPGNDVKKTVYLNIPEYVDDGWYYIRLTLSDNSGHVKRVVYREIFIGEQ